jgi:ATP-dependent DNA helicase RecG
VLSRNASPRRIAECLAAFANAEGGWVLLAGAEGDATGETVDAPETLARALEAVLLCQPRLVMPLPQSEVLDQRPVVALEAPAGLSHVYAVAGRYLVRRGRENVTLSAFEVARLLVERGQISTDAEPVPHATRDDLDWPRIERYLARLGIPAERDAAEGFRQRGGLAPGGDCPTYAGLLVFGREPERYARCSEIVAVRYAGREMSDRFVREEIRGPLPDQIQRAEAFAMANMRREVHLVGLERQECIEYPQEAVREAIVNAVAHRDYGIRGDSIRLLLFADRLEVYSPGRLPGHVTVENILQERFSRNEIIVQMLADLGFIERLGYGIDRMLSLLQLHGLPPPTFEETANGFRVTLWGPLGQAHAPEPVSRWLHHGYNPRQIRALEYLDQHERITNREYQQLCPDVSPETLRRDLAELVRRGALLKIGEKRGTCYVLR